MTGKATSSPSCSQSFVVERDVGWAAGLAARMRMMSVKMRMKPTEAAEKAVIVREEVRGSVWDQRS